jgi:hypothetical protein
MQRGLVVCGSLPTTLTYNAKYAIWLTTHALRSKKWHSAQCNGKLLCARSSGRHLGSGEEAVQGTRRVGRRGVSVRLSAGPTMSQSVAPPSQAQAAAEKANPRETSEPVRRAYTALHSPEHEHCKSRPSVYRQRTYGCAPPHRSHSSTVL